MVALDVKRAPIGRCSGHSSQEAIFATGFGTSVSQYPRDGNVSALLELLQEENFAFQTCPRANPVGTLNFKEQIVIDKISSRFASALVNAGNDELVTAAALSRREALF